MSDQLTKAAEAEYSDKDVDCINDVHYNTRQYALRKAFIAGAKWQEEQGPKPIVSEWQLCPKCNGQGFMAPAINTGTSATYPCDCCHGAKMLVKPILPPLPNV